MRLPANAHVAIVDARHFLLLRNAGTAVAPVLESEGQPEVDESPAAGASSAGAGPDESAHAAGAAEWLNRAVLSRRIERLLVVADPATLGTMRHHFHHQTEQALVGEVDRRLTGMPGADILQVIQLA